MDAKTKFLRKFGGSPQYSDRQLAMFAVLTAVGANLIFWGLLFKYREPETTVKDSGSSVLLLSSEFPDSRYWRRWICYNDPAKSGSRTYRGGFSAQLPRRELVDPPAERPRHNLELKASEVRKFRPLAVADGKPSAALPLPGAEAPPVGVAASALPTAVDDLGRSIVISSAALPEREKLVTSDTMLLVTSTGGKKNFIVLAKCGDRLLDARAAGMVAAAVDRLDPPPAYVVVRWPQRFAADKIKSPTGE